MRTNKRSYKILSALLAVLMLLSMMPLTAMAAPASDIPEEMLDNVYLDALAYTGYNVQAQKDDGTIFKKYGSGVSAFIRSDISYGTGPYGTETVSDSSTATGLAPDIAKFESQGLCCASYVSYVYFNYLPNVAGIDTSNITRPSNLRSATAYNTVANSWVTSGQGRRISFTQNSDGSNFVPSEEIPIGSLVVFKHIPTGSIAHVAIYAGYYNGNHFVTHVGNDRGPEFSTIVGMSKGDYPEAVVQVVAPDIMEPSGMIQVQKNDTNGKGLAGAYFTATSVEDSSVKFVIGPTDSSGFAQTLEAVPYGQYKVYESKFPTNYRSYGQTEWTVTVSADNDGVAKFTAVNELIPGSVKIVKEAEDGSISGKEFNISGNGVNKDVKTGADGTFTVNNLKPGTYTVSEKEYANYVPQEPQQVTVVSGGTAIVTFNNLLRKGNLTVTKNAEDGMVEGKEFRLYGTSDSGQVVDMYAVSDASGKAYFKNVPIGSYTLSEENVEVKYVVPEDQTVEILWNQTVEATVKNVLKKWRADVYKLDAELAGRGEEGLVPVMLMSLEEDEDYEYKSAEELGHPYGYSQGDATLAGAVYAVAKDGKILDTYTTDEDGYFITKWYPCGDGYEIFEVTPSPGYLLDETIYYPDSYAEWYTDEFNTQYLDVYEVIKKSNIVLVKHSDDGSTQIETPETGAKFNIYLKSAGSYANAESHERARITIDEHGFGVSKELPYGLYVVEQISGKEGAEMLEPFEVMLEDHAEIYSFIINNAPITALIDVVKKDATTGKTIPAAGVGFKVKDMQTGEFVSQTINYPTPATLDVFYTDENGTLRLPEALGYGDYQLIEITVGGAEGYVLDSTPVNFTVDGTKKVVVVEKHNQPQMGTLTIEKKGEVFASVTETDGVYTPVYEVRGLEGAVFSVYAVEDTYTLDGTLRYEAGQKITTLTTGKDGLATSEPIHLAKLKIVEDKAPYGMVLLEEPIYAELTYAGEEVKITTTSVSAVNERQKVGISLIKELEKDETYGIGLGDEYLGIRFGLFMAENLTAADGSVLPKDGLLETVGIDENGMAVFSVDVPMDAKLYVKEIATNEQYQLSDAAYPVEFTYGGQEVAMVQLVVNNGEVIGNSIIRGMLQGIKKDADGGLVEGAVYGLFKLDETEFVAENALAVATSDANGSFVIENIPYGQWKLKELSCPVHLVLSDEVFDVTVTEHGQIVEITVINEFVTGSVKGLKVDEDGKTVEGVKFGLFSEGTTEFTEETASRISVSDAEGLFGFEEIRYGKWVIKELSTLEMFLPYEKLLEVNITEHEHVLEFTVENEFIKGSIEGLKVDDDNTLVAGVKFGLFTEDTTDFTEENAVMLTESGEDGVFRFENVRYGKWLVKELSCDEKYVMCEDVFEAEVTVHGQVIAITVANKIVTGTARVVKLNADDTTQKLSGCEFEVYLDINGNGVFDADVDTLCGKLTETEEGIYELAGLRYGGYFLHETKTADGFIRDDGYYFFEIKNEGETVEIQNKEGVGFVNEPIPTVPDSPQTGDDSNLGLWLSMAIGSLMLLLATVFLGKKRRLVG